MCNAQAHAFQLYSFVIWIDRSSNNQTVVRKRENVTHSERVGSTEQVVEAVFE